MSRAGAGCEPALRRWRQRAQRVVPVVQPIRRQDRSRTAPRLPSPTPPGGLRSGGRPYQRRSRRSACRPGRQDRTCRSCCSATTVSGPMPPAVAAYSVSPRERSIAARLNASIAASHTATRVQGTGAAGQAEQRLVAARREIAIIRIRASRSRSDSPARVPVREPGAAVRAFPDGVGRARGDQDAAPAIPAVR